eukprot:scaffold36639_cov32-Tisochrysis_lutea.AAC.7
MGNKADGLAASAAVEVDWPAKQTPSLVVFCSRADSSELLVLSCTFTNHSKHSACCAPSQTVRDQEAIALHP